MTKILKAETGISLMVGILLFSMIYLSYSQWQNRQHQQATLLLQKQQALQIAENQIVLKMAKLPCENNMIENGITFIIQCTEQQIRVRFPMGEIIIDKAK